MNKNNCMFRDSPSPLEERADELRVMLRSEDPHALATRSGVIYTPQGDSDGEFKLALWNRDVILGFPDFEARDARTEDVLNPFDQALLVYYFHIAKGTPQSGKWISFTELPNGSFYAQAFRGYTSQKLFHSFGDRVESFSQAAERAGGRGEFFASRSYSYQILPRVALMVACWVGDEDFPSSYRVLFDAAAGDYLSTDGCAILGGQLTRRLIKALDEEESKK
ncbi:MAG: DUF3786 domain-containing protein [Chloroflexota bacterium]|nr:DUF3786 domain-containing protein [Chloroflexota bacterium]